MLTLRSAAVGWVGALLWMAPLAGCSGRNIHPDLKADPEILVREWTLPTRELFQAGDHGNEYSNPIVVENTLIFGNQSIGLVALYPTINQQRWFLPIPNGVMSELLADHGSVYFGGGDGRLYSVNAETGRVNWSYDVRNPVISRPTVSGGKVFVTTSDDTVYAFDASTGKWLWHYRRRSAPNATILGASAPLVEGNEVIVGLSDGFMVALSAPDGALKWEKKLHQGTRFTDVDAHPVLDSGVLYIPSYDGALYALNRKGANVIWRLDTGGSKTVAVEGQKVYLPSSDGNIYSIQANSGKVLWKFELDHGVPTRLAVTERYLIFGSSYQYLYVIEKETGKAVYRFNVGYNSGFSGAPVFDSKTRRVYFLSGAGNLYAFSLRDPKQKN